jgi:hypothetical protein
MVQLVTNMDKWHVQQPVTTPIPTTIYITTNLPTYVPRGYAHQPPNGGQPKDSLGGSSPKGDPPK